MFFNPGELEAKTNPLVWLDPQRLKEIAENYGYNHEVVYLQCPICQERMSHINFGGRSGVILDRCGSHGVWLQGGELRRLMEWWRAGGKLLHQQHELKKAKGAYGRGGGAKSSMSVSRAHGDSSTAADIIWTSRKDDSGISLIGSVLGGLLRMLGD